MFIDELRERLNQQAQIVTAEENILGILVAVTESIVTIRTSSYPGYGGAEDVSVRVDAIAYVRFFV